MKKLLFVFFSFCLCATNVLACTGISISTLNKDLIQARTIEWSDFNLNSKLVVSPSGYAYTATMPDKTKGLSWTAKYGFVGISVSENTIIGEGLNEKGLNAGVFFFGGYGQLAPFDKEKTKISITDMDFVRWALSNFATVDELLQQINSIRLVPYMIENGVPTPTGHWRVADKTGKNVVIEFTKNGTINVYDNIGVLTNNPEYPWHVANLNNYIHMQPGGVAPKELGPVTLKAFGMGAAAFGLPGDITPPSRFVRAAFYLFSAPKLNTSQEAVQQAFHILNNFDIPIGSEFADKTKITNMPSATQWTAASDLSNAHYYFKSMYDSRIKRVDVKSMVKQTKAEKYLPLANDTFYFENYSAK